MPFYRQGLCKNAGPQILRQRLRVIYDTSFHCASLLAVFPSDRNSHDFPVRLYLLIISAFICARSLTNIALRRKRSGKPAPAAASAPFTLRAAACIAARLCCRVTVKLHQNPRSFAYCTRPVRHFRRAKRQSDAQPPHRAMPLFSGFRRLFPHLTRLLGPLSARKGEKDRYRGGHDAPEDPLLTQAACTAYSLKLPIPQQTATPA